MKKIPVGHGKYALVDDEDYKRLRRYKWHMVKGGYAVRTTCYFMHKIVRPSKKPFLTDHRNRNRLDNQKHNLRVATYQENRWNSRGWHGTRKYTGTTHNGYKRYGARMMINKRLTILGWCDDEHTAALLYDFWATYLRSKEKTVTNFKVVSDWTAPSLLLAAK